MTPHRAVRARSRRSAAGGRVLLAGLVAAAGLAALALAVSRGAGAPPQDPVLAAIARCDARGERADLIRCHASVLQPVFSRRGPRRAIALVERLARERRLGLFRAHCHRTMHEVAMRYARRRGLTMAQLRDVLLPTYGPGCTSGFDHGLIIHAGAQLDPADLAASARRICGPLEHRFSRQACVHGLGHAFLVVWEGDLRRALQWCRRLGASAAPDCADAAFHGTAVRPPAGEPPPAPQRLCRGRRGAFAGVCWRRAWTSVLEHEVGPRERWSADAWIARCGREPAESRAGCVTSVSRHLPSPPAQGLAWCRRLARADRIACVRGIRVSRLPPGDRARQLELVRRCATFPGREGELCARVLGRNLDVLTDGRFERSGCDRLEPPRHRRACRRGARRSEGPLVTYG